MSAVESPGPVVEPTERRPARIAELFLLVLALGAGITAFAMVGRSMTGELPEGFWPKSTALTVVALGAHVVLRIRAPWADQVILPDHPGECPRPQPVGQGPRSPLIETSGFEKVRHRRRLPAAPRLCKEGVLIASAAQP